MSGIDGHGHADREGWPWDVSGAVQAVQALGFSAAEVVFAWRLATCPSQLCVSKSSARVR